MVPLTDHVHPLRWSPGAAALVAAMRERTDANGWLYAEEAFGAMLSGTPVGSEIQASRSRLSATSSAVRGATA